MLRNLLKMSAISLLGVGFAFAETPAEWAAKWQGIQNGIVMKNYSGVASYRGTPTSASTRDALVAQVASLSPQAVYDGLIKRVGPKERSVYGTCIAYVQGSDRLFLIMGHHGTNGHSGYPKNPSSGDSTGYTTACFNEHIVTGVCRSGNWQEQMKQTLLLALKNDACTDIEPVNMKATAEVSIMDSNQIYYVSPSDYCANGAPLCGTTKFGDKQGAYESFNLLPEKFCRASYGVLEKTLITSKANGGSATSNSRIITCDQLNKKQIQSDVLAQAKNAMATLNDRLYILPLPFSGYSEAQLTAMGEAELSLYLASVDSRPELIKIESVKARAVALSPEIKAEGQAEYNKLLEALKKSMAEGSLRPTYSLADAIAYIQGER